MNKGIDIRTLRKQAERSDPRNGAGPGRHDDKNVTKTKNRFWAFLNRDIQFGPAIPDKIKEDAYLELGSLLDAGVDIRSSLDLVCGNQPKKKYRETLSMVTALVVNGATLSSAMQHSGKFTAYEYLSIRIGEETGKLVIVLQELALYYKKKIRQRRQIVEALTYPCIVMAVACLSVTFMIAYVVPMFSDVFKRFGGDLPATTRMVVGLSHLFKRLFWPLVLIGVAFFATAYSQRKRDRFRAASASLLLRIPVVRTLIGKIYLARFANTMALLTGSRIPIIQSLQMTRSMIGFYPLERSLERIGESVMTGMSLHKALSEHPIYPKKMVAMIKVGEDVNQLDLFFRRIADRYAEEVEYQTALLSKFVEPLIIVLLGLVVGVILIAMYLPLFKLGQAV